ncbi:hypothetical protein GS942_14275 [Rhodococcus hoagii]|nr:hypothetical protein [Prescottella equi]
MQHVEHDETNALVDDPTDDPGSEYTEPELDPEAHMPAPLCGPRRPPP